MHIVYRLGLHTMVYPFAISDDTRLDVAVEGPEDARIEKPDVQVPGPEGFATKTTQ